MGDFDDRYVSIEKETTYGTDPDSAPKYGEVDDESLKHTYETLVKEDMSRFAAQKVVRGKEYCEGSLNAVMMTDDFTALLIRGMYATDTVTGAADPYTHTMEEGTSSSHVYPSFSLHVGRTARDHTFTGMTVNRMSVSASVGEFTSMSFDLQGQGEAASSATMKTPTYPTNDPCFFANADVFFNNDSTKAASVKSMDFEISVDRDLDSGFSLGDLTLVQAPPVTRRSASGTIEFNKAVYTASNNEPTYDQLTQNSGSTFLYDASASGETALKMVFEETTNRDITFSFFKVFFEAPDASVTGRDHQTMTTPFMALYEDDNTALSEAVIRNATATAY